MTITAQNTRLPYLGADIRPAQPERPYWHECSPRNLVRILPVILASTSIETENKEKTDERASRS